MSSLKLVQSYHLSSYTDIVEVLVCVVDELVEAIIRQLNRLKNSILVLKIYVQVEKLLLMYTVHKITARCWSISKQTTTMT